MSRNVERLVLGIGLVTGLVIAVLVYRPPQAQATPACVNASYNVEGTNNNSHSEVYKGMKALVHVGVPNSDCSRVSSLGLIKSDGRFIEWGWGLGYIPLPAGSFHAHPLPFACWRFSATAAVQCDSSLSEIPQNENGEVTFRVDDGDQDYTWEYFIYSSNVKKGDVVLNWRQGLPYNNGERDCTCDSAWAHFQAMQKWKTDESGFSDWGANFLFCDLDPGYNYSVDSDTEGHVLNTGSSTSC